MGTLDPRKLIYLKINHMNIFHMKISQITVCFRAMPQTFAYDAQIMPLKLTLCSLYLYMSSYCNLITNIAELWISVVFIISLQHEISCTKDVIFFNLAIA